MDNTHTIEIIGVNVALNARLSRLVLDHKMAEVEVNDALRGRKVRFRGWLIGGQQRTGTIVSATIWGGKVAVGVDVDRVDGRPGFTRREGVLADTWYGSVESVEVVE